MLKRIAFYISYIPMPGTHVNRLLLNDVLRSVSLNERIDAFVKFCYWFTISFAAHGLGGVFTLKRIFVNELGLFWETFLGGIGFVCVAISVSLVYLMNRAVASLKSGRYRKQASELFDRKYLNIIISIILAAGVTYLLQISPEH